MKKFTLSCLFSFAMSSQLFAFTFCEERQIFEAKIAHANTYKINVAQIQASNFQSGPWTRMDGNNHGSSSITLTHWTHGGEYKVTQQYVVYAHQIGHSEDCKITDIVRQ